MSSPVPDTVHELRVPQRFRSRMLHAEDAVLVLCEFIAWLERAPRPAGGVDGGPEDLAGRCDRLERDRQRLVMGLIELTDLLDSPGLRRRATDVLAAVGVRPIDSAGERFDPSRHRAVERIPTVDPAADGLVAETERVGYEDGSRHARLPDVLVYQHEAADGRR